MNVGGGGGGCNDTDGTVPLTGGVSVESEPTCKASLVPTVGTNGIADQSAASSQGSRDALSQKEVAAESVTGSSGGRMVTAAAGSAATVSPVCYVEQEVSADVREQSVATDCVQRVAACVYRGAKEVVARDDSFRATRFGMAD